MKGGQKEYKRFDKGLNQDAKQDTLKTDHLHLTSFLSIFFYKHIEILHLCTKINEDWKIFSLYKKCFLFPSGCFCLSANCCCCCPGGSGCVSGVWQWGRWRPPVAVWRLWWQLPHLLFDPSSDRRSQRRLAVPQVSGSGEDKLQRMNNIITAIDTWKIFVC